MAVLIRAKGRRASSLLPHGGAGHAAQSLLCRAEPALSAGQELPAAAPADRAAGDAGSLRLACGVPAEGTWRGGALSGGWPRRARTVSPSDPRPLVAAAKLEPALGQAARHRPNRADFTRGLCGIAARPRHQPS